MRTLPFLLLAALAAAPPRAQNCGNTSIGATPLADLGAGTYHGFTGGLYPGGTNARPAAHEAAGAAIAQALPPRDLAGNVDLQNGRIVLLSIGMSNTTQEFSTWLPISNADPERNPRLVVVDGAQGGQHAAVIVDPTARFWTVVEQRLAAAGVSVHQVAALWIKQAVAGPSGGFPGHAQTLQGLLAQIVRLAKVKYPNVALCYLSSRIYAGYATTGLNPEPYAYESAFSVQWLVADQIAGRADLNYDPARGPVVAPWLAWGPYLWADGTRPRSDGLTWVCNDFATDGTHPGPTGRGKVALLLDAHFRGDTTTRPWYLGGSGARAAILRYGAGCPGGSGPLMTRYPTLPYVGNPSFQAQVGNAAPDTPAALFLGSARADLQLTPQCRLLVDPTMAFLALPARTTATGRAAFTFAIPQDPNLLGQSMPAQWLVADPQGQQYLGVGIALTDGNEWRFGTP